MKLPAKQNRGQTASAADVRHAFCSLFFYCIFCRLSRSVPINYSDRSRRQSLFLAAVKADEQSANPVYAYAVHFLGNIVVSDLYAVSYNV